jgi:hypothetical protein
MRQARVLPAPRGDVPPRRQRHVIQCEGPGLASRADVSAIAVWQRKARHGRQRLLAFERCTESRHRALGVVHHDGRYVARQKRTWAGGSGVPADDDGHVRRERADLRGKCQHFVRFERVHRGDADEGRPGFAHLVLERPAEAEIGQRDAMAIGFECRGDVLHAERLDAKERTQTEPLVVGNGA